MAQVEYRFTFLDVLLEDEERGKDLRADRARSAPPLLSLESPQGCWKTSLEEAAVRSYVHSLPLPTVAVSQAVPETQAPAAAAMSVGLQAQDEAEEEPGRPQILVSAGSLGHPELCQRPCVHVAAGRQCEAGDACNYCHHPHRHVPVMDKRQRHILEEMPKADFLRLALQLLEDKARTMELHGTEVLFGILQEEMPSESSETMPAETTPRGPPHGMSRCLRAASFSTLASLAARKCTEGAKMRIREAMQTLRAQSGASQRKLDV